MALTDGNTIKLHTQLKQSACDKAAAFVDVAEHKLIELITQAIFDALSGTDKDRATRAESYLCIYFAMQFSNLRPTDLGGFSKIIGFGDQQTEQLMSKRELESYRQSIYNAAVQQIAELMPQLTQDSTDTDYDFGPFGMTSIGGNDFPDPDYGNRI